MKVAICYCSWIRCLTVGREVRLVGTVRAGTIYSESHRRVNGMVQMESEWVGRALTVELWATLTLRVGVGVPCPASPTPPPDAPVHPAPVSSGRTPSLGIGCAQPRGDITAVIVIECYCCCSVAKSCPTLCHPIDCSTLGFPDLHCLPEFAQTDVRWVGNAAI